MLFFLVAPTVEGHLDDLTWSDENGQSFTIVVTVSVSRIRRLDDIAVFISSSCLLLASTRQHHLQSFEHRGYLRIWFQGSVEPNRQFQGRGEPLQGPC